WGPMGIYTFRIKGSLCHRIGALLPNEGEQPKFAQIYITDSDPSQQVQHRLQHGHGLIDEGILRDLQAMMHRDNPYYDVYKIAKERMGQDVNLLLTLTTFDAKKQDPRRYNLPTASEVGVIIPKDSSNINATRDLIIEHRGGQLKRISELHSAYLPLRFPLLFPYGEPGWHPRIPFSGVDWRPQDGDDCEEQLEEVRAVGLDDETEERGPEDAEGGVDGARGTYVCLRSYFLIY